MEQLCSHWTDLRGILNWGIYSNLLFASKFSYIRTKITDILHRNLRKLNAIFLYNGDTVLGEVQAEAEERADDHNVAVENHKL